MGYKKLINNGLKLAFNSLKDLAEPVILSRKASSGFDFTTGTESDTVDTLSAKAVIVTGKGRKGSLGVVSKRALFRKDVVGSLSAYDVLLLDGLTYRIGQEIEDDGFIIALDLYSGGQ